MTLALLLSLASALPAAAAVRVIAPPGNSEADQYYQTVPGATGPRAPVAKIDAPDGALSQATEGALRRRGATGQALATAVARTAPPRQPGGSGSPSSATQALPSGKAGLGTAFPLVLVAAAAAAAVFAVAHRRRIVAR